ncbi:hypothetical protein EGT67_07590 [Prescottella agglutinans]|uniref:Uncharacterized protein n=1 Tax=Prescottella agglutinans TaxID=1644129 RepID=A0A3S3D0D6_9NOCA|nr:hypothetical protein EGT67_07590 [Prescottella agglutinans]
MQMHRRRPFECYEATPQLSELSEPESEAPELAVPSVLSALTRDERALRTVRISEEPMEYSLYSVWWSAPKRKRLRPI